MSEDIWSMILFLGIIWCLLGYEALKWQRIGRRQWHRVILSPLGTFIFLAIELFNWLNSEVD